MVRCLGEEPAQRVRRQRRAAHLHRRAVRRHLLPVKAHRLPGQGLLRHAVRLSHRRGCRHGRGALEVRDGGAISVGPACADGSVFAGQQGGERFFYCVDAETGVADLEADHCRAAGSGARQRWTRAWSTCPPSVATRSAWTAATGHIVWMFPTAKSVPAEPAIDGDLVYFGSWSRSIYAFDKKTGEVVWKENGVGLDSGTLIAFDGKLYLPHHRNIFKYLDAKDRRHPQRGQSRTTTTRARSPTSTPPRPSTAGAPFYSARGRHRPARRATLLAPSTA